MPLTLSAVWLPRAAAESPPAASQALPGGREAEDEVGVHSLLCSILREQGYRMRAALES